MQKKNRAQDYYEMYAKDIVPIFNNLENTRLDMLEEFKKDTFNKYILPFIICVILVLFVIFFKYYIIYSVILMLLFPISLCGVVILPIMYFRAREKANHKFTNIVKAEVLQPFLKVFGDIKWIGHESDQLSSGDVFADKSLMDSALFISYNNRYSDDEFTGSYKGVPFKIAETRMYKIIGSSDSQTSICAFKGVILSFRSNKKINNRTIVATKGDFTKKNQALATVLVFLPCCFQIFKSGYSHWKTVLAIIILIGVFVVAKLLDMSEEALDEVKLEDPEFSKRFNVYSSDQVEARYLVTTSFMQRFYDLKTAFRAKNAKCSFFGDTLMIAINTNKNLFEICNLFKSLNDPSSINEFYSEITSVYNIIDYLKLDEKTGL